MKSRRILVIDDDRNIAELLKVNLDHAGYDVVVAFDGMQAVTTAQKEKPDLILLDIMLPAGSGFTVLRRLRMSSKTAMIPVIAMSAFSRNEIIKKLGLKEARQDTKVLHFFSKPLDVKEVVKKIDMYFTKE
ncbi:PleD family two-component system response regulator [Acidobacteriota bacterium]